MKNTKTDLVDVNAKVAIAVGLSIISLLLLYAIFFR